MAITIYSNIAVDLAISGQAQGDILYCNGTNWVRLAAGTSGQVLQTQGASANPRWIGRVSNTVIGSTSNPTTTSATYVVVPQMTITATTNGGNVLVMFNGLFDLNDGDNFDLSPFLDGVEYGSTHRSEMLFNVTGLGIGGNATYSGSVTTRVTGLAAGSHTFDIRWRAIAGTARGNLITRELVILEVF